MAPATLPIIATPLMIQFQSFPRRFLVFSVAPLARLGVVVPLLLGDAPLGFVIKPGVLALLGIPIRTSVIRIERIKELRTSGTLPWKAVIEASEHRMRSIMVTAAAATLPLTLISRQSFYGPMADAMMGSIVVGTAAPLLACAPCRVAQNSAQR